MIESSKKTDLYKHKLLPACASKSRLLVFRYTIPLSYNFRNQLKLLYAHHKKKNLNIFSDLKVSSLQSGLCNPAESLVTPISCRLFLLRSSSLRWEGLDFSAETRESQLISVSPQLASLLLQNNTNQKRFG